MDYLKTREIYHHGIKGQRWGVRKYQNPDGTLTAEGRSRYGVDENGKMSREGKKLFRQDKGDQKILDRSNAANAFVKATDIGAKYLATEVLVAFAGAGLSKLMKNSDAADAVIQGTNLVNKILSGSASIHMIVGAVQGANEKDKIRESQK